jgi:hypothetical protein
MNRALVALFLVAACVEVPPPYPPAQDPGQLHHDAGHDADAAAVPPAHDAAEPCQVPPGWVLQRSMLCVSGCATSCYAGPSASALARVSGCELGDVICVDDCAACP